MASRVVLPNDRRVPISGGDWLLLKERLNSGENKRMLKRGRLDMIEAGTAKVLAYLLDWSVKGPDGKVILVRDQTESMVESALDSIDPESYTEILRAVEAHEAAMEAERDQEKNSQGGETVAPVTSPSLSAVAGALTGSGS